MPITCNRNMLSYNEGLISLLFLKFYKLSWSLGDLGNFAKTLKICMKLILNCPRLHVITYTKGKQSQNGSLNHLDFCESIYFDSFNSPPLDTPLIFHEFEAVKNYTSKILFSW